MEHHLDRLFQRRAAGAHAVLPYDDTAALAEGLRAAGAGKGADPIVDVDAAFYTPLYPRLLAPGGTAVVYGSRAPEIRLDYRGMMRVAGSVSHFLVYTLAPQALESALRGVDRVLAAGAHRFPPAVRFDPAEAAAARLHVEQARPGKALLRFGD